MAVRKRNFVSIFMQWRSEGGWGGGGTYVLGRRVEGAPREIIDYRVNENSRTLYMGQL